MSKTVLDEIFSIPTTESFNIVWNKIMENLWDIDSYQDIIDTTARLAETDPTFYALNEMFTSEGIRSKPLLVEEIRIFQVAFREGFLEYFIPTG